MAVKKQLPAKAKTKVKPDSSNALTLAGRQSVREVKSFDDAIENADSVEVIEPNGKSHNEMDTQLDEPVQDTAMAKYSQTPTFDASDLFIPKLRLAQGLTTEVQSGLAKPGDWLVLGSDPMKAPTIVPMLMVRRRELRDSDENRVVMCRSSDSVIGVGNPGGECATCPMSKWIPSTKPGGKNQAPPCTFIYSYIVYVVDTDELCVLEFYRTSIPTGKMLNTMVLQKGLGNFAVQLKSNGQQGPRGTFYQASIQPAKVKEEVLKTARAKAQEMF